MSGIGAQASKHLPPPGQARAGASLAAAPASGDLPGPPSPIPVPGPDLASLHVGMGWHDEQPGGLNRMVANLLLHLPSVRVSARALVAGSAEVERLSNGQARAFARLADPLPLRVLRAGTALREAVRRSSPDVVALHFALFGLLGGRAFRHTPLVVHFHGPWADEGIVEGGSSRAVSAKRWVENRVYRPAGRFITLSEAFADVLERHYGVDRALVRVVPGGVDTERFEPSLPRSQARHRLGLSLDRPIILTVRRLTRRMGLPDLVTAFATLRRRVPEALLVIAGSGPLYGPLEAQIRELGLEAHARLLGRVPDDQLPILYRAADLSVVPSTALEGFGLTTVESLASGTPVLVASVGGAAGSCPRPRRQPDPAGGQPGRGGGPAGRCPNGRVAHASDGRLRGLRSPALRLAGDRPASQVGLQRGGRVKPYAQRGR